MRSTAARKRIAAELGPLEERVLNAIWKRGTTTVRELMQFAQNTLMTTLDRRRSQKVREKASNGDNRTEPDPRKQLRSKLQLTGI